MNKKKIIIVGGGFSGVYTALYLDKFGRDTCDVELINDENYFVFQPLLPEVVSGTIGVQDAVTPLRLLLPHTRCRSAKIVGIDFVDKKIRLVQGARRLVIEREYDHIVLAAGQEPNTSIVPGLADHSLSMRNLADASSLRNHIIKSLEWADVTEVPEIKKSLLTFVVAGGGFSGIETIGEVMEMLDRVLKFYPRIKKEEIHAIVLQGGNRILPELHPKLSEYALKKLRKRNIDVYLDTQLKKCSLNCVVTSRGQTIYTRTLISTIGNSTPKFICSLPLTFERGRILASETLQASGHEDVWCLGDVAAVPSGDHSPVDQNKRPNFVPPTAQAAVQEARVCAKNIIASCQNKMLQVFRYKPRGTIASLGNYSGVGEVLGLRISGFLAWAVWRGFYILKIPSFSTKVRITLNWLYDYFFPRTIVHMSQHQKPSIYGVHIHAGDVFLRKDQLLTGVYKVISGVFELIVDQPDGSQTKTEVGKNTLLGDHITGEDCHSIAEVRAKEDSYVMICGKDDFRIFQETFAPNVQRSLEQEK